MAAAQPGSKLYGDIVRWATTIKSRPGPIFIAYQHEPEVAARTSLGSARDFVDAYRRVVTIFRSQGVNNVSYAADDRMGVPCQGSAGRRPLVPG